MDVSLVKLLLLLYGLAVHGSPDRWDVGLAVGATVAFPGPTATLEVRLDPVAVFYRPLPSDLCGYAVGAYVVVNPDYARKGCQNTLEHELGHIQQTRAWGLVHPLTYPFWRPVWEPPEPWRGTEGMYIPKGLNWPLIRVWLPLGD